MSRTKPLSGLKLGMDNSPIVVCIKELEGDSVGLIISQEGQPGKEMTTPVIRVSNSAITALLALMLVKPFKMQTPAGNGRLRCL